MKTKKYKIIIKQNKKNNLILSKKIRESKKRRESKKYKIYWKTLKRELMKKYK